MVDYERYKYSVKWSEEDQEYVGLCTEFHSLSYLDKSRDKALKGIVGLIKSVVEDNAAASSSG